MKVFKNIRKNNGISQILFSCDWNNKSTLHCNGFNSLGQTTKFEFSLFQHSIPILLAFLSAKSVNPPVFRMRILLEFFSAKPANSTVFRIPILMVTEISFCEAYRFQKTSQTSDAQKNTPSSSQFFAIGSPEAPTELMIACHMRTLKANRAGAFWYSWL